MARAWRGHGAGVARPIGIVLAWGDAGVARAWRGRGAGMSCSPRDAVAMTVDLDRWDAPTGLLECPDHQIRPLPPKRQLNYR
eukprot:gene22624-biopygen14789